ncbi:hypothetical protein [Streptomyces griseoluteus]|uniref:hypothetical protein n=1 Tax=Streptomyces griseoluteus TaxID=29306 RepID=UPI0037027210
MLRGSTGRQYTLAPDAWQGSRTPRMVVRGTRLGEWRGEPLRGPGPFESAVVVIAQPERPFFGSWKAFLAGPGPLLVLSTAEDTPLGWVKPITKVRRGLFRDDYALVDPAGSLLLQIEVDDVLPSLGRVRFRFTDASGDEVGTAVTR